MNDTYEQYQGRLRAKLSEPVDPSRPGGRGKFRRRDQAAAFSPVPYPGSTVLANPYPLPSLGSFVAVQHDIATISPGFAQVPADTLHVTVADLIAGSAYAHLSGDQKANLVARAQRIVEASCCDAPVLTRIAGLTSFSGAMVAVVDFPVSAHYGLLTRVRDLLYADPLLASLGVRSTKAFIGHITLGYFEQPQPQAQELQALASLRIAATPDFELRGAAVFTFPHMCVYERVP